MSYRTHTLEVRRLDNDIPKSFLKTYSALANADGGVIYFGAEWDGEKVVPVGIPDLENKLDEIIRLLHDRRKVSSDLTVIDIIDEKMIRITVEKARGIDKPVFIHDDLLRGTYQRMGSSNFRCKKDRVFQMIRE